MGNAARATTTVKTIAKASAKGLDLICLLVPAVLNADGQARLFGSAQAIIDFHGYNEGAEYAALHIDQTEKSVMVVALPITVPGVISRENVSGNTGSATSTITAAGTGIPGEHHGILTVIKGGTVGTDQIILGLSLDDGYLTKTIRFGTGNSYTEPNYAFTIALGAGTLNAGETIHTWHGSGPRADATGLAAGFAALGQGQTGFRSALLLGDLQVAADATAFLNQLNSYATAHERFVYGRASVLDRLPKANSSKVLARMTGAPALTFAEVGGTGDTITRATGSWLADGFVAGDWIAITGTASNNVAGICTAVSALVITLGATDLTPETTSAATVTAAPALAFAVSGHTITRSRGSWLDDGFRIGDVPTITGSVSNNTTLGAATNVTALVMTFGAGVVDESASSFTVSVTTGQTKAAWMAAIDAQFSSIDAAYRIDLSAGRGRVQSPYSLWSLRRPAAWFASIREYQHDLHIPTWRKSDGPCGANLFDQNKKLVEYDDRPGVDGDAGSVARFTTLRTYGNDTGAFISQSLTRDNADSLLSQTHNVSVVNLAQTVTQSQTETSGIGRVSQLNPDGTMTSDALSAIAGEVNEALSQALQINAKNEGPRCSFVKYTPSADDLFNVPNAVLTGVTSIELDGTVHDINTIVSVS